MAKVFTQSFPLLFFYRLRKIKKRESSDSSGNSENEQDEVLRR